MSLHLKLTCDQQTCRVAVADTGQMLAETPLANLPDMRMVVGDPPGTPNRRIGDPYGAGERLFTALGGAALHRMIDADAEGLLLLECDDRAAQIPWEYAATSDRRFLVFDCAMLRLEPQRLPPLPAEPPRLLVVCADPLHYLDGREPAYRLDFEREMQALCRALTESNRTLVTRRVPPTPAGLREALADGPALVHFSCHGSLVSMTNTDGTAGFDVLLELEDEHGVLRSLLGRDLIGYAPRGSLRLVVLSACQSAPLARAFVRRGVPMALGMQHNFPDALSDDLVAAFYRYLSAGHSLAEALRQAQISLAEAHPATVGMLVGYARGQGWQALNLPSGKPDVQLDWNDRIRLPEAVVPPATGLLGRNAELVALAEALTQSNVATIVGAGGIGKTALAAAFIRRFAWRFGRVVGVSFANAPVDEGRVCRELIERLVSTQALQTIISTSDQTTDLTTRLRQALLALIKPDDLVLFDNYESVLTPEPANAAAAQAVQRLPHLLRHRGANMLFTSRAQPVGLAGERLIPDQSGMRGLAEATAIELFQHTPVKAFNGRAVATHQQVAKQVAAVTEGYPLAIQLLAAAYDTYDGEPQHFLARWDEWLAVAERQGLDPRHARFATAIEFSLAPLTPLERERLIRLSAFDIPFLAEAAAFIWDLPVDEEGEPTEDALREAVQMLGCFRRRSLLQVEAYHTDETGNLTDRPAIYRFQPAIRQELCRRSSATDPPPGAFAYGVWLARRAYYEIDRSPMWANLVWRSLPLLTAATDTLNGEARLWHIRQLATFRRQFGALGPARADLERALTEAAAGTAVRSALLYELAYIYWVQGDVARAKALYEESLAIFEALQDVRGKSATLHALATIYRGQGELARAKALYEESLAIKEALQDVQGKSATLHDLAYIYRVQGDVARAKALYEESLAIQEELQYVRGKSATLHALATIYRDQGELARAKALYEESLAIKETLQDVQGKSATLRELAYIYRVQGDVVRAKALYEESLALFEALQDVRGKSATLHALATIYRDQGDVARAKALYEESLAIFEALQDVQGKSATLHELACIYRVQGDVARAKALYEKSLALFEALQDVRGKSATLHALATIYRDQEDVARAKALYEESLAICEVLQDVRGKSTTLYELAYIYRVQGDVARAKALYEESLAICEALQDVGGRSLALVAIADLHIWHSEWDAAADRLNEALTLVRQLGNQMLIAFCVANLGKVAQAQGDRATALERYRTGLAIFEQLNMQREVQQVRQLIAALE